MVVAYRLRPLFRPALAGADRPRPLPRRVDPIRTLLLVGVAVVLGLFAGGSGGRAVAHVPAVAATACRSAPSDPYFHKDIGFYVFDLPWLHFLVDFVMAVDRARRCSPPRVVHYLYGGIRLQATQRPALRRRAGPALGAARALRAGQGRATTGSTATT